FVHGCFWHGHHCALFKWPKTRAEFWREKIARNRTNDAKALAALAARGWRIAVIWECALRGANRDPEALVERLSAWLKDDASAWFEARG
ncbi:MAG TPA: very short patch repair endonuclease, partial [Paraburkholderia sp.]